MIKFSIPIRTKNPLNGAQWGRSGFYKASKRKRDRKAAWAACYEAITDSPDIAAPSPAVVTLRRVSPRALDGDGLQAALKSVRDGIADALGVNDGSDAVTWRYDHRRGKPREYAVEVEIAPQEQTREVELTCMKCGKPWVLHPRPYWCEEQTREVLP